MAEDLSATHSLTDSLTHSLSDISKLLNLRYHRLKIHLALILHINHQKTVYNYFISCHIERYLELIFPRCNAVDRTALF